MVKWLVRRAAVWQPQVRIMPNSSPLVQPRKILEQESNCADFSQRSSRRVSPSSRMDIVSIMKTENYKINKKSAGKGTKKFKSLRLITKEYIHQLPRVG